MIPIGKIEYIIIHHTDRNIDFPSFIKLRHRYLRGWDDIGYHYLIGNTRPFTKNGKLYSGRSEELKGAHTLGYNNNSLGICLIGNYDNSFVSEKQFETLFSLLEQKIKQYNVPVNNVKGHNEFLGVDRSCPGRLVNMAYIRAVLSGEEEFSASRYVAMLDLSIPLSFRLRIFSND
jgi:N-acetylmuramoyl-L-alanine amidase